MRRGFVYALLALGLLSCARETIEYDVGAADAGAEGNVEGLSQALSSPVETPIVAVADTFIRKWDDDTNYGGLSELRAEGTTLSSDEHGLVRFDSAAIASAVGTDTLEKAELELTINHIPGFYGDGTVSVHRMTMDWTETGATWDCANDTATWNFWADCTLANRWGFDWGDPYPQPYVTQATASKYVSALQTGTIRLDVTADVQQFLANPSSNHGWLIKAGSDFFIVQVHFKSRETTDKPRLVVTHSDFCPDDPTKSEPGECGCGQPDADLDHDGVADCIDECPLDDDTAVAGQCGCPSAPAATGKACFDGLCASNHACDGAGHCGHPDDCAPVGGNCHFETYPGMNASGYWVCNNARTWTAARTICQSVSGGDLIRPDNAVEDAFAQSKLTGTTWLLGRDSSEEGKWVFEDDAAQFWQGGALGSARDGLYTNWSNAGASNGQPDNLGNADCNAYDYGNGNRWSDDVCSHTHKFICEVAADACPDTPLVVPGRCGCLPETDNDANGKVDCTELSHTVQYLGGIADKLARRTLDPTVTHDVTSEYLATEVRSAASRIVDAVPRDAQLMPNLQLAEETDALGLAVYALTLAQLTQLGVRPNGTSCENNVVARLEGGVFGRGPLAAHYRLLAHWQNKADVEQVIYNLGELQAGIRCLNHRELSVLETAYVEAFLTVQDWLRSRARSVMGNRLWDQSLPAAIMLFDATKYFQFPKSIWVLRYAGDGSRQLVISPGVYRYAPGWLADYGLTLINKLYCDAIKPASRTLDRVGVWTEDPLGDLAIRRINLRLSSTCAFLTGVTDLVHLGAGDCSLAELAVNGYRCLSPGTCEPQGNLSADALPGDPKALLTQFLTLRPAVRDALCLDGFNPGEYVELARAGGGCSFLPSDALSYNAAYHICEIQVFSPAAQLSSSAAITWRRDPRVPSQGVPPSPSLDACSVLEDDSGDSDEEEEEEHDEEPPTDTDEDDVTDEHEDELEQATRKVQKIVDSGGVGAAIAKQVGSGGLQPGGDKRADGHARSTITAAESGKVRLHDKSLSGNTVGRCCTKNANGTRTIDIDVSKHEVNALNSVKSANPEFAGLSLGGCKADAVCGAKFNSQLSKDIATTIAHELLHDVAHRSIEAGDVFTTSGRRIFTAKDKENTCRAGVTTGCGAEHKWIYGQAGSCAPDQPCGNVGCNNQFATDQRMQECVAARAEDTVLTWCPGPSDGQVSCRVPSGLDNCLPELQNNWDKPVCAAVSCAGPDATWMIGDCCGPQYSQEIGVDCTLMPSCACCAPGDTSLYCTDICADPCPTCADELPDPGPD